MSQDDSSPGTPRKVSEAKKAEALKALAEHSRKVQAEEAALEPWRKKHLADLMLLTDAVAGMHKLFHDMCRANLVADSTSDPLASTMRNFHNKTADLLNALVQHIGLAKIVFSNNSEFKDSLKYAKQITSRLHANNA